MKKLVVTLGLLLFGLFPEAGFASVSGLKISPLKYQQTIDLGHKKEGFIEVSNPTDSRVHVVTEIQAFRQVNQQGDLEFYDSERISKGILIGVPEFDVGPREAYRIKFRINPNRLGEGGANAALFFRTQQAARQSASSKIATSVRVGSLLILDVGGKGHESGELSQVDIPRFNFKDGVSGSLTYRNSETSDRGVSFSPRFVVSTGNVKSQFEAPLATPGNSRHITFSQSGSFIGLIPVKIEDAGKVLPTKTVWVLAVTGYWRWVLLIIMAVSAAAGGWLIKRKRINM